MSTALPMREKIRKLKQQFDTLRIGKDSLLQIIDDAEISESVYNSNAIENSTLTLKETERILLEMEVSRNISLREVFEAKNLARVTAYVRNKSQVTPLTREAILLLHEMLISNIDDAIAGRFRLRDEYVRVGTHIASPPEFIETQIHDLLIEHMSNYDRYVIDGIAYFHLVFETIHPFNDGNGRIGRIIINYQLQRIGFPPVIIRDKEKNAYYRAFTAFRDDKNTKPMERIVALALCESLHKRIAYLEHYTIIPLVEYARRQKKPAPVLLNSAQRQSIPAFREKGMWKIGIESIT